MSLTVMTPSWRQLADKITLYILKQRLSNDSYFDSKNSIRIYNEFISYSGSDVDSAELASWCVNYITIIINMPLGRLKQAADIDGLKY
ncbi:MAG: hypothetical protein IJ341_01725 [Bacteroidales bacterium]|nr:hypothetical protein [Bacteroidales bacterium]